MRRLEAGALMVAVSLAWYGSFLYAPTERVMGQVQRIFYVHLGLWGAALLAFLVTFLSGIQYLRVREAYWDELAGASAEIGVLFNGLVILTGAVWAKPTWGVWWTWEPQLTSTLLQQLVYLGYLVLRAVSEGDRARRLAAVVGILAFLNLPLVFFSVRLLRGVHPVVFGPDPAGRPTGVEPAMVHALGVTSFAFVLLYSALVRLRLRIGILEGAVRALRMELNG
ncbi:MAG: cytochrome c biogenesis protein CcsA [Armatimonadota bacterium]|nr:cytochrome c biogenesis protein CcsA [Armatimonadota bacterium]MDR7439053.1 cytochrome c biogenesis protein CcsA [Armatimonadota bacterium]MDR7563010.1 cytochrome c biogenesis protein CcsA [Armatimonadota bacterium]MDR7568463.1 cytochrome c biogenesis protein CcsA [Armatimonadota bacterium]MDR7600854.1 cytochrome c biogenesis protein CcsA [Armatimonadota bacterium]